MVDLVGTPGREVIKLLCSAQLRLKFILLINVKIVGIFTFIRRINYCLMGFMPELSTDFGNFSYLKIHAQHEKSFITSGPENRFSCDAAQIIVNNNQQVHQTYQELIHVQ